MRFPSSLLLTACFLLFFLTSCVRDYTCQCTITYTGQPGLPEPNVREYPIRDTKKKARSQCQAKSFQNNQGGILTKEDCDLF